MGKRRQKDKSPRQEEDDIDLTGPSCCHIRKGIDRSFLKRTGGEASLSTCQDCKDEEQVTEEDGDASPTWMCLKCGHRGCGRNSENQHAIKHYEKPHSDPHCLVVNLDSWSVWCYICDNDVQFSRTGSLAQLLTNLKKQASSEPGKRAPQKNIKMENSLVEEAQEIQTEPVKDKEEETQEEETQEEKAAEEKVQEEKAPEEKVQEKQENKESIVSQKKVKKDGVVKAGATGPSGAVKGLSNLGNTCFFNAVVQNLSQTRLLRQTLNTLVEEQTSLTITPSNSSDLEPILVQLERPGSLTLTMCQTLNEIQETKKGVVTPRELFTQVCKKAARFKGFQQQDSQELLRYLLDGMRAEEIKRVSSGISEALKKSGEDAEQSAKLVKEYEKNGACRNFVDQVFGGEMTSTVMCQRCQTVSSVTDKFLDLSLSVSDEAYRKKNQKKPPQRSSETGSDSSVQLTNGNDDDMPTGAGSKYQQKKAKKQAKKQAKNQRRQQKAEGKPTLDDLIPGTTPADRAEGGENGSAAEDRGAETDAQEPGRAQGGEDERRGPAGEEEDSALDCDPFSTTVVSERFAALSEGQTDHRLLGDPRPSKVVPDGEDADEPTAPTEEEDQLVEDLEHMSLNTAFIAGPEGPGGESASGEGPAEPKEYTVVNRDPELVFHTLATRTVPEKQECSVQSCLFQFTEVETLTQNNSLLCATCTKRHAGSRTSDGSKKSVYTDALKQMLISSAPPVLTLHLKRFQQVGYSVCKVNRHVTFPQLLDLAPFCAVNCKGVAEGEDTRALYSLYGIVEHSGTMRSGHYTAYVKTAPHCPSALPNGAPSQGEAEASRGPWFHVSDSSVHAVTERQVQSSQAYLLFYERIS